VPILRFLRRLVETSIEEEIVQIDLLLVKLG
jgi:hypothetical protein